MRWASWVVFLPACFHPSYGHTACGVANSECPSGFFCNAEMICERSSPVSGDASIDGSTDGSSDVPGGGCTSFATLVNTCQLRFDADLTITADASYDTDAHVLMFQGTAMPVTTKTVVIGSDQVDVISAINVQLGPSVTLHATGSHGLAIVASNDLTVDVDSQIDVSKGGAGARTSCPNGATNGQANSNGGAGGGGGGYGADGGNGGAGDADSVPSQGGMQGKAEPSFPAGLHGGCPGADGGQGDAASGKGGKAGGALYIAAANRIVFDSSAPLDAGGGGGQGGGGSGNGDAGGGGGGSGGLLIVEAPHIMAPGAVIAANGGAGGEGSSFQSPGASGGDASDSTARATGGAGGSVFGSDGGDGGSSLGPAGDSVTAVGGGGGGGGGGGVGWIRVRSPDVVFQAVSPQATN